MSNIERRELIQIALAGAFVGTVSAADKPPLFFTGPEYNLLEELCEVILPADSEGPGAKVGIVSLFVNFNDSKYAFGAISYFRHPNTLSFVYTFSLPCCLYQLFYKDELFYHGFNFIISGIDFHNPVSLVLEHLCPENVLQLVT